MWGRYKFDQKYCIVLWIYMITSGYKEKKNTFLSDSPILFHRNPEALEDLSSILATIPSMEKDLVLR